ncbi:MAG: hypothetical protein R6U37_01640 [Dehalococcoidia bacterium]
MIDRNMVGECPVLSELLEAAYVVEKGHNPGKLQTLFIQTDILPDIQNLLANPPGMLFFQDDIPIKFLLTFLKSCYITVEPAP